MRALPFLSGILLGVLAACGTAADRGDVDARPFEIAADLPAPDELDAAAPEACTPAPIAVTSVTDCVTGCATEPCLASQVCISPDPACFHAAGAPVSGLYRTSNGGRTWRPALVWPPDDLGATQLAAGSPLEAAFDPTAPDRVYVATLAGVYRSDDGGAQWTLVLPILCTFVQVHPLSGRVFALEPADGHVVLHRSDDHGATWQAFYVCQPGHCAGRETKASIYAMALSPASQDVVLVGGIVHGFGGTLVDTTNLLRSTDGGASWRDPGLEMQDGSWRVQSLAFAPSKPERVYAGLRVDTRLYVSDDAGAHWAALPDPGDYARAFLLVDALDADHVWRGGDHWKTGPTLYESVDAGLSWQVYAPSDARAFDTVALGPDGPTWGYRANGRLGEVEPDDPWCAQPSGCDFGSVVVHDVGGTWEAVQCGLPELQGYDAYYTVLSHLAVHPADPLRALASVRLSYDLVWCD